MYKKIAEKLYENFVVNTSVAAIQQKGSKYFTVKSPITVSLIEEMLRGGYAIGTYQQLTNQNKLRWICFDFDCKNQNKENTLPELAKLNSTIHSLELPILYGYSFVKSRPYGMALFIGPKLEYVWKHKTSEEFEGFGYSGIKEELHPINISSVIGLGVNIANIFFDFRYEIGLTNISKSIIYEKDTDGIMSQEKGIFINRHRNVLSFSLGVIF